MARTTRHHLPSEDPARDSADRPAAPREVRELETEECWAVLGSAEVGHLALRDQTEGIDVFPVNFVVHGGRLYFRTAPGTKLEGARSSPLGALLVDEPYRSRRVTVLMKGRVETVVDEDELVRSGLRRMQTYGPGVKMNYLRMVPSSVTGRYFRLSVAEEG